MQNWRYPLTSSQEQPQESIHFHPTTNSEQVLGYPALLKQREKLCSPTDEISWLPMCISIYKVWWKKIQDLNNMTIKEKQG